MILNYCKIKAGVLHHKQIEQKNGLTFMRYKTRKMKQ